MTRTRSAQSRIERFARSCVLTPMSDETDASQDDRTSRLLRWTREGNTPFALFFLSIAESTVFPIPIEMIMTPVMLADRARIWIYALMVLAGCVVGSTLAYMVGYFFFETLGQALIETLGQGDALEEFRTYVAQNGALATFLISITPIPLITASLGAGLAGMNFVLFIAIVAFTRALRYFGIGILVALFGKAFERFLDEHMTDRRKRWLTWSVTLVTVAVIAWLIFR